MTLLKTLGSTLQDILFLRCEKELRADFLELDQHHFNFILDFNADIYIKNNPGLHLYSTTEFVQNYQNIVEAYIYTQTQRSHKLLIHKKYLFYIFLNQDSFYELFNHEYEKLFNKIDMFFAEDSQAIQMKIIEGARQVSDQEGH